jgi:hypothetical protein
MIATLASPRIAGTRRFPRSTPSPPPTDRAESPGRVAPCRRVGSNASAAAPMRGNRLLEVRAHCRDLVSAVWVQVNPSRRASPRRCAAGRAGARAVDEGAGGGRLISV